MKFEIDQLGLMEAVKKLNETELPDELWMTYATLARFRQILHMESIERGANMLGGMRIIINKLVPPNKVLMCSGNKLVKAFNLE